MPSGAVLLSRLLLDHEEYFTALSPACIVFSNFFLKNYFAPSSTFDGMILANPRRRQSPSRYLSSPSQL